MINDINSSRHLDKLRKRRDQANMTLEHITKEQRQAEQNSDWLDQAAYESRMELLDRLIHWYVTEIEQIDKAVDRIGKNQFGQCAACHRPIELEQLEISPEAEFCSLCQDMREKFVRI